MKPLVLATYIIALLHVGHADSDCPSTVPGCTCETVPGQSRRNIRCVGLSQIPYFNSFTEIFKKLDMDSPNNNITIIQANAFSGINVEEIDMSGRNIKLQSIHPMAFSGLERYLTIVKLQGDTVLPPPFEQLKNITNLQELELQLFNMPTIEASTKFNYFPFLRTLRLRKKMEHNYKEGGQRNWVQVLCNGGMAAMFGLQYMFHVGCREVVIDFSHHYSSSWLAISVLGSLACCCGDTFSSELGAVFSKNTEPRLITTFRKVPRGTNGGITLIGSLFSLVGGGLVGLAYYITQIFLLRESFLDSGPPQWPLLIVGLLMGIIGSTVDSLLGATFQYSGFHRKRKCVVEHSGSDVDYISGMELLDNHSVNLLSSLISALISPKIAFELWRLCS